MENGVIQEFEILQTEAEFVSSKAIELTHISISKGMVELDLFGAQHF